ncbi:hypothetical protein KKD61_03655 [Patescibacteria group bacterium]|nr:hypothetical protein [Patescibacteria group bacterium]
MKDFKFGNKPRDRKGSPRRSFGSGDYRKPLMYDAICDECGKNCQVPFKPSGDKPVYCSECFEKKGGRDGNKSGSRKDFSKRNFGDSYPGKSPQSNINDRSILQLVEKIETLNAKLDTIIGLLSVGQKKIDSVEGRTEKNKKSKNAKAGRMTEALTSVEKKDADLTVDNAQENIKSKPKKRAKTKVDS